jgi:hypothetical protein
MLSSNVISGADYLAIATYYANARIANVGSVDYLYDAVYKIVLSDNVYPTIDLINEFWTSYQINTDIYRSPTTYLSAVRAINNHVINRSGSAVTDLNDYLIEASVIRLYYPRACNCQGINGIRSNGYTLTGASSRRNVQLFIDMLVYTPRLCRIG